MNRPWPCLTLIGLLSGCGESGSPPAQATPEVRPVQSLNPPDTTKTMPAPTRNANTKIEVKGAKPNEFTRIEGGNPNDVQLDLKRDQPLFYPVLRNFDEGDYFTKTVVYVPVVKGLGIFACRKVKAPGGGIGLDYVLKAQLLGYELDAPQLIDRCYENFFNEKLEVKVLNQGDDRMLSFSSSGGLVTALLGHSSTYERFSSLLDAKELAILIDGPHILLATTIGSSFEKRFPGIIDESESRGSALDLDPAIYHWTAKDGLTLVKTARQSPPQKKARKDDR